jgi:ABC-type multidrug transport system fused ATPase/permease subunit
MSTLTLSNVSYYYNNSKTPAVSNVSCSFEAGKLYAIVGPSVYREWRECPD